MRSLEERNKLFEDNINLVHFIISRYFNCFLRKYPYLKEDLFQEGYIGLHKATCCFDESKGKFSTIAFSYISGYLKTFTNKYAKKHYRNDIDSFEKCIYRDTYGEEIRIEDKLASNESIDIESVHVIRSCIKRSKIKNIQKLVYLREKGYSQKEIGKMLGTSQASIYRRLKKLKVEINMLGK
ncbi:sigma-70 family RNA polymerase sigma factor [Clostridioides difficile]|uniref:sigma-70 family RNA polymerase sigma factor n=1 Tax=Clostridioides difficile TaxID=1496 RepID=UPI001889DD88|nr:sigma-70 family RNA polymerase sigma factor [Clostridioides difficile]EJX3465914.1 sigma-70 family RNA polymerase sigma factor [Clostridioides difficile]EKS6825678.1 sigma-70 family RNA polymerase sigma factor [Clostridioides difficile]MBF4702329.1 sigma-70 family RNA polymerase sigma factor [Clostridioides difficile]MDO0006852.1 sigma-70 family RNA polymerase sigma factor [Clostridioides difficile]HBF2807971.1 sigma-70 family RNA polymerase sigma factor [Clostridioides difficile]